MHRLLLALIFFFTHASASLRSMDDLPQQLRFPLHHHDLLDKKVLYRPRSTVSHAYILLDHNKSTYTAAINMLLSNKNTIKLLPSYNDQGDVVAPMSSLHAADYQCMSCLQSVSKRTLCNNLDIPAIKNSTNVIRQQHPLEHTEFLCRSEDDENQKSLSLLSSFHEIDDKKEQLLLSMSESYHEVFEQYSAKKLYEVDQRVIKGGALYYQLHTSKKPEQAEQPVVTNDCRKDYLRSIVDLMWYLYHESGRKKEAYQEGMVVVHDPESVVYSYLLNYARMVNPSITGTLQDPALLHANNPFAYPRQTSHLKDINARAYAIDMRFEAHESNKPELPAHKRTFFFEHDGNNLYIKLENYGLSWQEAPSHALELGIAQLRKIPFTKKYIGGDDQQAYKKERVPSDVLNAAQQFFQKKNLTPEEKKYTYNLLKTIGIKAAFEPEVVQLGSSLIETFDKNYDHLLFRRGRETILDHELASALYYQLVANNDPHASDVKQVFDGLNKVQRSLYDLKKDTVNTDQKKMLLKAIADVMHNTLTQSRITLIMRIDQRIGDYVNTVCARVIEGLSKSDIESQIKALTPRYGIFEQVTTHISRTQA